MRPITPWRQCGHSAKAKWILSLAAVLLIAEGSSPLLACDDGIAVADPENNPGLVADCKALLAARDKLAGNDSLNWNADFVIEAWHGITVSGSPRRVTQLLISPLDISGEIPAELGQLSHLTYLFLSGNLLTRHFLTGEIPPELGQLSRLKTLFLNNNYLTGPIPPELGQLSQLKYMDLGTNQLTGPIPPELGQLSRLERLHLWGNQRLRGPIPAELGRLSELRELTLAGNELTGMIPPELGQLSQLGWLDIGSNQLTGIVPPELGQLSRMGRLSLRNNQLTGEIPVELGNLSLLGWLYISNNQLSGEIPTGLGELPRLRELDLSNNRLRGNIPTSLGHLTNLEELSLAGNLLTGEIPVELTKLSPLKDLQLSNNRLRGRIPPSLGQLTNLVELNFSNNQLSGEIPSELGQLSVLKNLLLSANRFTGRIPKELGKLSQLSGLYLDNNQLTGMIPPELSQLSLGILHLQHNQLTGPIPAELGQYRSLREFSYRGNELTGPVPPHLSHLPDVYVLNLTANRTAPDRIEVTWDDPGDATVSYEFRLLVEETRTWTEWAQIKDPETTLRRGEGPTIEWTLTGLPTDIVHRAIEIRVSNTKGSSSNSTRVTHLESTPSGDPDPVEEIFVPVILTSAGRNDSFFTSELTLTNRGDEEATLHYTYTARSGGGNGTATDRLAPARQRIKADAIGYLQSLGIPIPNSGNRIGTLRVEVFGSSGVSVVTRTTTAVPDGRAGLSYPGIVEEEGFQEAVYLCGLRQNRQDRSNVAFQHMGAPGEGSITLKTTVFSGEAADTSPHDLGEMTLQPGGFHQYSGLLGRLGSPAQGYVKVEKVDGDAPFYAYGVINDNFNSDGSFVFPVTESSLVGRSGQTLPVIIETGTFQSELTLTNFSASDKQVDFSFGTDPAEPGGDTATFSLSLKAGEQSILPNLMSWLRQQGVAGIGPAGRAFVRALFATAAEGDMSGIVIGARTGSPDKRGGQYSLFYNGVPYGSASIESAWIYGLQQNEENRSNLALVNTGEIDDSSITLEITIYDGSGKSQPRTKSVTLGPRRWTQENGILGKFSQGYVQVTKTSGNNPFVTYGVVNDGGRPGERSGDGAFLLSQE